MWVCLALRGGGGGHSIGRRTVGQGRRVSAGVAWGWRAARAVRPQGLVFAGAGRGEGRGVWHKASRYLRGGGGGLIPRGSVTVVAMVIVTEANNSKTDRVWCACQGELRVELQPSHCRSIRFTPTL